MLINSLILFIEETLPIFILYSYINVWEYKLFNVGYKTRPVNNKVLHKEQTLVNQSTANQMSRSFFIMSHYYHLIYMATLILGLLFSYLLTSIRPWLDSSYTGIGYEVLLVVMTIVFVISVLLGLTTTSFISRRIYLSFGLFILVLPHASDFIVFFDSVSQPQLYSSITIGVTLALGICVSITYLLFFLFLSLKYEQALKLAVSVFLAGQLSNVVTILQQVDLLPSTLPLWNTNEIIADKHEFGQFFHVLFGYDATPTAAYLSLLILSTLIMFTFLTRQAKPIMMQMPNRVNRGQQ